MGSAGHKEIDPKRKIALGLIWLREMLDSRNTPRAMGRKYHRSSITVRKYVSAAVDALMNDTQEKIIKELFPLAIENIKAHMQMQVKLAEDGKLPDISVAHGVLKSMYVFDAPVKESSAVKELAESVPEGGLAALMVGRPEPKQLAEARERRNALPHETQVIDVTPDPHRSDSLDHNQNQSRPVEGDDQRERQELRSDGAQPAGSLSEVESGGSGRSR